MPYESLYQLAQTAAAPQSEGILGALGIQWQMLLFQAIAFGLVVFLMAKFVYPILLKVIDERETRINQSLEAAKTAEDHAGKAEERIEAQLAKARTEAREIVSTAKDEATAMLAKADEKSKSNAEHLIDTARSEIDKEVIAAKKALQNETIELVASATEKVVSGTLKPANDKTIIETAIKEAKN